MRLFNPSTSQQARAVQAWQILVGAAMTRQTLTYKLLGKMMFQRKAEGVLNKALGHIAFYCIDNELPPLTSIVVGSKRGKPGEKIPIYRAKLDEDREKVYATDWYNIHPPTEQELHASYKNHK
jgi:hypothetical protein